MNVAISRAAHIIIMPRFALDDALKLIDREKPTIMPCVPTLLNAIMSHPKIKTYDLSSLRFCLSGGAALPLEVKQSFEAITGCKVVEGYGLSETRPVAIVNPIDGPVKPGSIGVPVAGTVISLRDLADPTKEVPVGEKGEICIKGPQVMRGYYKRPEDTAEQMVGEFLRTGDVARMDAEGYFFIEDRIKDLIISSGFNVYPRRIEEAIYEHAAVAEVTVIGIKDKKRGEAPKAFVRLKPGASVTVAELCEHLAARISKIEMPAEIEFRDELPKTMIGKLSKKELKAEEDAKRAPELARRHLGLVCGYRSIRTDQRQVAALMQTGAVHLDITFVVLFAGDVLEVQPVLLEAMEIGAFGARDVIEVVERCIRHQDVDALASVSHDEAHNASSRVLNSRYRSPCERHGRSPFR